MRFLFILIPSLHCDTSYYNPSCQLSPTISFVSYDWYRDVRDRRNYVRKAGGYENEA